MDRVDYAQMLQDLLPQGIAWPRQPEAYLTFLLYALASEFEEVDKRGQAIIEETDPRTLLEMLPDWERVVGLPDPCLGVLADTLPERREAVWQRWTARGGQSIAYFTARALQLGYAVTIIEYRPFVAGLGRCGDTLNGGHDVRHIWSVIVPDARLTYFRTGQSAPPDKLLDIDQAEDLECLLMRLKPAHTHLIFSYEGI